jgi:hypothetical protein
MSEPFIFIGTHTIREGKLEDFKKQWLELLEVVEAKEPRLIAFNAYVNEDGTELTIVQVHPDADSMGFHMQVAPRPHQRGVPIGPGEDEAHRRLRKAQRRRPGDDRAAGGVGGSAERQGPPPRRVHPLKRRLSSPSFWRCREARRLGDRATARGARAHSRPTRPAGAGVALVSPTRTPPRPARGVARFLFVAGTSAGELVMALLVVASAVGGRRSHSQVCVL